MQAQNTADKSSVHAQQATSSTCSIEDSTEDDTP